MDINQYNNLPFIDSLVVNGEYFGASKLFTLPSGATTDFLLRTGSKYLHGVLIFKTMQTSKMFIYLGGVASSNGTPTPITNFKTFSSKTPSATFYSAPTMSSLGALGPEYLIPSGSGKGSVGASAENPRHFILPPNFNVLLRFQDLEAENVGLREG